MAEQEAQPGGEAVVDEDSKTVTETPSGKEKPKGKPFDGFDLPDDVVSSLKEMGISHCTPIQEKVIEPILAGGDIIGKAETGTGKTIGFGAPLVARIDTQRVAVQGIVLTPTRELAQQVAEVVEAIGKGRELRVVLLVGGVHASGQIAKLRKGSQLVVGTPGRVLDLLKERILSLGWCENVVLDEADRMLDMGFIDEVGAILDKIPPERQTLLFSATIPDGMKKLLGRYMKDPKTFSTSRGLATVPDITQGYRSLSPHQKLNALRRILDGHPDDTAIIFCNTKRQVIDLDRMLWGNGYSAGCLHGDQTQDLRFTIMDKFRSGDIKVLVATDVASRGLDIESVSRVINYDVPEESESYVHRIGRTGRANKTGIAITFVTPKDRRYWEQVLKDTRFKISNLAREKGRRMGNTPERGEGSSNKDERSGPKPRKRRRRRGRKKGGSGQGSGKGSSSKSGEGRRREASGSSGRGEDQGGRSRRKRSSQRRRGKRSGDDGPKPPKMEPEFGSVEEMEETIAEVKALNEEKRKRQQSRPDKITLDVVDDDYLKEEYFDIDSEVLERADAVSPRKPRTQEQGKKSGGDGKRRRRRRRSRSRGGGRGRGGGGRSDGEKSGGEQQSSDGSKRKRRPRRRRRRRGRGGGGDGGGGGGES